MLEAKTFLQAFESIKNYLEAETDFYKSKIIL